MSMDEVGGVSPHQRQIYKKECLKGANLFEQALEKHHEAKEEPKKAAFQKVMEEALQVMNQTAKWGCSNTKVEEEKEHKLQEDYQSYLTKENEQNYQNLLKDIEEFRRSIE